MLFQQHLNGLALISIYALIALGYTMVYGILEFINFTPGEIYLIGAYLSIIAPGRLGQWGLNALAVIVFATIYATAYGATIEKIAYKPLRKPPDCRH